VTTPNTPQTEAETLVGLLGRVEATAEALRQDVIVETVERQRENELLARRIDAKNRLYRRSTLAMFVAIACAIGGIAVLFWQLDEAEDQRNQIKAFAEAQAQAANQREIDQCENSNERIKALRNGFNAYTDALVASSPPAPTPEAQAERDARVAAFKAELSKQLAPVAIRDCSAAALGLAPPTEDPEP
jgi:hypothetical protein